jgi:hypothetical protein
MIPAIQAAMVSAIVLGCFAVLYITVYSLHRYVSGVERLAGKHRRQGTENDMPRTA